MPTAPLPSQPLLKRYLRPTIGWCQSGAVRRIKPKRLQVKMILMNSHSTCTASHRGHPSLINEISRLGRGARGGTPVQIELFSTDGEYYSMPRKRKLITSADDSTYPRPV